MLLNANIFQPLIDVFEAVLKFFHHTVGVPWGWAIVLLTVLIRLLLVPLTVKQFHSMQALQRLQPELKALQGKYKDDKQRQQQELMKFYKENNVNPLGSCLPMVAQLPVMISLFYMLRQSLRADICPDRQHYKVVAGKRVVDLSNTVACGPHGHAGFLFISDLTNKATGVTLIVLILLYVGTQLASSMMMSTPTMDSNQRRLMMIMPLFFVLFVVSFPAGVIVYWITTNTWTMAQQYILRRRIGPMGPPAMAGGPPAPGDGNGGGPSSRGGSDGNGRGNGNGGGSGEPPAGGGLGGLLRGRLKGSGSTAVTTAPRPAIPPPSPRKKKKRSGRRR
jgi:YidC/Oxa1 family membrane protein insertase